MADIVREVDQMVRDETVEMGRVLRKAGRRAVRNLVNTMENSGSEVLRFKAAQDLADRSPETSKTQKVAVASFSLAGEDAKALAQAMTEAARVKAAHATAAEGDYVKIDADKREVLPAHAERISASDGPLEARGPGESEAVGEQPLPAPRSEDV